MANTHRLSVVSEALKSKFDSNRAMFGLEDVWYGDQMLVPRTPAISIEPGNKSRELQPLGLNSINTLIVYVLVYLGKVQEVQKNRLEVDKLSEDIEDFLHQDKQLGGLVIHGFVAAIDPGLAPRPTRDNLLRVDRITWQATSKTMI